MPGRVCEVDPAQRGPGPALIPTARGLGLLAAFSILVALSLVTGSLGPVALLAAVGVTLLVAPATAWARGRRALASPPVHVLVHALPAIVAVGGSCTLEVLVIGPPDRWAPPLGLDHPDRNWRLTHRLPHALAPASPMAPATIAGRSRRWLEHLPSHLAPGPLSLLPLCPTPRDSAAGTGEGPSSVWASPSVPTGRRGVIRLPALHAWTHDPLGLFGMAVAATPPLTVVVHPQPAPAPVTDLTLSSATPSGGDLPAAAPWWAAGGCGDFSDLRPYVPGDRLHLVDWQALARYDRLLVRRFDPELGAGARIVLDDRAGVHRRAGFDQLLSTLIGMVELTVALGRPMELSTLSGLRFTVAPTPAGFSGLLAVVATLDPRHPAAGWVQVRGATQDDPARPTVLTTSTGAEKLPAALRYWVRVLVVR